jgi:hypothetical protein
MIVCALTGYLTARLFNGPVDGKRLWLTALVGLLLGLAVNFRLPNLFLASGYFVYFFLSFLMSARRTAVIVQGAVFTGAFVAGMAPTLLANAVNAGSPLATTYGGQDVVRPEFSLHVLLQYVTDLQFALLILVAGSIAYFLSTSQAFAPRRIALLVGANLLVNLAFFLSHPIFTPYYMIPIATLSLWTLLFAGLMAPADTVGRTAAEPARSP